MPNTKQCFGKMPYFSLIKAKNISLLHSLCREKYIVCVLLLASFSYLVLFCVPVAVSFFLSPLPLALSVLLLTCL